MSSRGTKSLVLPYWAKAILIIIAFLIVAALCAIVFFLFIGPRINKGHELDNYRKMADRPNWEAVANLNVADEFPATVYQSKRSKLRVVVADVPGPMVKGAMSFVTETHSDDGLPHTLEHLVFMGSKKYPYKGVLDVLANLCLASGTNAWTAQDHTAYTLFTVGAKGFLKVLPVYIDHVLDPTLTEAQYMTEVHHINGKGEDAGVVYSEMQNYESDMSALVRWARMKAMYPEGNGYSVETGGRLSNLRNSTNNEKVREFHKEFYHLDNMMITILGMVDHDELLSVIEPTETGFLEGILSNFSQPFSTEYPFLNESETIKIKAPSDDVVTGMVEIAWFGPDVREQYKSTALDVLFDYLSDTASSPLEKDFVQLEDPYAASVSANNVEQARCQLVLSFTGVPTEKLDLIVDRLYNKTLTDHEDESKFDMDRMGSLIDQTIQKILENLEAEPKDVLFSLFITHQVYGDRENFDESLNQRVNIVETLTKLKAETAEFWRDLLQTYLTQPYICIIGVPSEQMVKVVEEKELNRVQEQKERLGEEGLKECGEKIEEANNENNANKPGDNLLEQIMVKDLEDFNDIRIEQEMNFGNRELVSPIIGNIPVPAYLHDVKTKFIEVHALFDTQDIPAHLRKYTTIWYKSVFESSAMVDGNLTSYENVSLLATKEVVSQSLDPGLSYNYERIMHFALKVDASHINRAAKWLDIYLNGVVFEEDRLMMQLSQLISYADDLKRDGNVMMLTMYGQMINKNDANAFIHNLITLQKFHQNVLEDFQNGSAEVHIENINKLRSLVLASKVNVHVACDRELVEQIDVGDKEMWQFLVQEGVHYPKEVIEVTPGEDLQLDRFEGGLQAIMPIGATESAFLKQSVFFNQTWLGENVLETMLMAQYLSQLEGPLYRGVRGRGLAYSIFLDADPDRKLLSLTLYRCSQTVQAYEETKKIVTSIIANQTAPHFEFEGAKRSLISDLYTKRDSIQNALKESILSIYRGTGPNFMEQLSRKIWELTPEDVFVQAGPYMETLFDDSKAIKAVIVPPSKVNDIQAHFGNMKVVEVANLQLE
ncbi:hypothetical protein L596_024664 [Steinernema carpocapsae]|uniref:Peptidase M16C associated domain-containing protein n=1 Tax=Steinernema carpocapsae TaxID=34508 RepID=A0A4U5M5D6_STECR|nr:hypothetical protein L596_024664 [Steinernema carpocapsae]